MNIKINDNVRVITGKYKGKEGKVLKTSPKNNTVIVEGVNLVHKHEKARKANETSKIVTEEAPIDVSNVEIVCEKCGKAVRIGHTVVDGKKVRVCKKCGAVLDKAYAKKAAQEAEAKAEAPKKRTRKRSAKNAEEQATVESTSAVTGEE